jgi:NitT/TauT family transport system ATP-binding protein
MKMNSENLLVGCEDVSVVLSGRRIVEGFSLRIRRSARVAFLGPSGCGKSTLLNLISGIIEPSSGTVSRNLPVEKISFVFQDASLIPWKTVCGNLQLVNDLMGSACLAKKELSQRIANLLEQVGLSECLNSFPDQLSGGMKMRVALARALMNSPDLLLLDEPFSALDDLTRERLQDDLLKMNASNGSAFVMVTHNIDEALLLCSHICVFSQDGKVIKEFIFDDRSETFDMRHKRDSKEFALFRNEVRQLWNSQSRVGGVNA